MSPRTPKGVCVHCHRFVEHHESAAYWIHGVEVDRKRAGTSTQGGANQIRYKKRQDNWIAHNRFDGDCLDAWAKARDSQGEQTSLI